MNKLDLTKIFRDYYKAGTWPEIITFDPVSYMAIEGVGDPSGPGFASSLQSLYPVAYTLKFMAKAMDNDFTVPKLEGQWWYDTLKYKDIPAADAPRVIARNEWYYRLLLRIPETINEEMVQEAIDKAFHKRQSARIKDVSYYTMHEGKCVQMLHKGPFSNEPESIELMIAFMQERGLQQNGLHHEIYLSDFRKTPPERLNTILREPVK